MTGPLDPRAAVRPDGLLIGLRERIQSLPAVRGDSRSGTVARGPGAKGLLLYVLPLPALLGAVIALGAGHLGSFLGDASGFGLLVTGAWLHRQGIRADRAPQPERFLRRSRWPLRSLGGALVSLGAAVTAYFGAGHGLPISLAFGGVAALGFHLAYGFELARRPSPFDTRDARAREVAEALGEAEGRLLGLERAAVAIANPELRGRVHRIAILGQGILGQIADRPTDLFRARKFLNVYLEGVQQVAEGYARTHRLADSAELEQSFRNVLVTVEQTFEEQSQKLLQTDLMDLDVQIEVLKKQLEREGIV